MSQVRPMKPINLAVSVDQRRSSNPDSRKGSRVATAPRTNTRLDTQDNSLLNRLGDVEEITTDQF